MGLLDSLFAQSTYGGQGGGLLDMLRGFQAQQQVQPSAGFADTPSPGGRLFDASMFDPATYAPSQEQPPLSAMAQMPAGLNTIGVGNYQMPRIGDPQQFMPDPAQLPPNSTPAQGQVSVGLPPQQQAASQPPPLLGGQQPLQLPPAFGGGSALGRMFNPDGLVARLTGNDSRSVAQQNLKAQYDALVPMLGPQKAMLAVMNKEAGQTLINEALSNKEKYQKTGTDAMGNETYGFVNDREQTVNGKPIGAGENQATAGFLAPGVKSMDSSLTGQDYLKQFSPEIQAAVTNYIEGKSTPTGNPRKGFTQTVKMIAQKYGADIGQPADDANYMSRRTMRNQLSSSAPSTLGGQINIGNTAAGHLADLTQRALDLDNSNGSGIPIIAHGINEARGFLSTEQAAKMEALKGAAQHYGQEITKFYAGSPGGVAERDRFIESVNGAKSPKELAAILATEGELMRSRLDALGGQIKGVLGDEGLKQYPVLRPDGQAALAKVEANVSRLKGGPSVPSQGQAKPQTVIQNGHSYTLQADGSYK